MILLFAIESAGCLTISAQSTKPRDDVQIWTETQVAIPLDKKPYTVPEPDAD